RADRADGGHPGEGRVRGGRTPGPGRAETGLVRRVLVLVAAAMMAVVGTAGRPAGAQTVELTCRGRIATIIGTPGDDLIRGTPAPDVIVGLGGGDLIFGGGGNDVICGGEGDDSIDGGAGDDVIDGGAGNDGL